MAKSYGISESQLLEIETARKKNRNKNVERRLYVLVMRAEGKSLEEISEKTGYHISTASKLIARYIRDGISAIAENHYIRESRIPDRSFSACWKSAGRKGSTAFSQNLSADLRAIR